MQLQIDRRGSATSPGRASTQLAARRWGKTSAQIRQQPAPARFQSMQFAHPSPDDEVGCLPRHVGSRASHRHADVRHAQRRRGRECAWSTPAARACRSAPGRERLPSPFPIRRPAGPSSICAGALLPRPSSSPAHAVTRADGSWRSPAREVVDEEERVGHRIAAITRRFLHARIEPVVALARSLL